MFVALKRWVAVGILGGAFVAGGLGGFVLHAWQARHEAPGLGARARDPEPSPRPAAPIALAAPVAPLPPQSVVVRVVTETARPAPLPPQPHRPAPTPPKASPPKAAPVVTERPAALGVPEVRPTPTPGHFYKVQAGDTLHEVTVRAFGGIKRLGEVIHANPALDPNRIRIGVLVYVPAGTEPVPAGPAEAAKAPAPPAAAAPPPTAPATPSAPSSTATAAAPSETATPPAR